MPLNDPKAVTVDRVAFEFNGRMAYGVRKRASKLADRVLIGHVARSQISAGRWCYLLVTEKDWTLAGSTRADAIDHLLSAHAPSAPWLSGDAGPAAVREEKPQSGEKWSRHQESGALVSVGGKWKIAEIGGDWPFALRRNVGGLWDAEDEFKREADARTYAERAGL